MSQKLLQVDRLTTGYRTQTDRIVQVLRNVSLEMQRGETLGLVGESGCGKTTFGMTLLGHLRPGGLVLAGSVRFEGWIYLAWGQTNCQTYAGSGWPLSLRAPVQR